MTSTLHFEEETRIICIAYVKLQAVSDGDLEPLVDSCEQELKKKTEQHGEDVVKDYIELVTSFLPTLYSNVDACEKEADDMEPDLKGYGYYGIVTQDRFNQAVRSVIKNDSAESLQDITSILNLLYVLLKKNGEQHLTTVLDLTVTSFMLLGQRVIQQKHGWLRLPDSDPDLSSSIVLVPEQVTTSTAHVASPSQASYRSASPVLSPESTSPPTTPTLAISHDEGSESMDSATPPEIIEKPSNLTASLIQLIDSEASSTQKDPDTPINTPTEEDAATAEEAAEEEDTPTNIVPPISDECTASAGSGNDLKQEEMTASTQDSQYDDTTATVEDVNSNDDESSGLSSYIPHISLGVAAAAACIGLFVMKK